MVSQPPSKTDARRWRKTIVDHLSDFPRQHGALEHAMATINADFDLQSFKAGYESEDDFDAYNQVQAVERAASRVQDYVAELAIAGVKLAQLDVTAADRGISEAQRAFEALRDENVIGKSLCRQLTRAQSARSRIEHSYVKVPAGDVHAAVELVRESSADFVGPFAQWVEQFLV